MLYHKPVLKNRRFSYRMENSKNNSMYKSGSMSEFGNYRPISTLPIVSKVIEKAVHKQLTSYFETNNLLNESQFGFRSNRSTELAAAMFTDDVRKQVDKGSLVGAVFVDLGKAFDTVSHATLLHKLESYGIRGLELEWFADYLFNRSQYVRISNNNSDTQKVINGVPQGSVLGPLLVIIFLNTVK